jgi:hypothetical protein
VFQASGVLSALFSYYGQPANGETYTLKDLFYKLPFIHRAYMLTYSSQPELFYPIGYPRFVSKDGSAEAWFCAEVTNQRYTNAQTMKKLPSGFEHDKGVEGKWIIRKKKRFDWKDGQSEKTANLNRLSSYHKIVRRVIVYIHVESRLWYFK